MRTLNHRYDFSNGPGAEPSSGTLRALPRAHDAVRALYRHRIRHVRELLARLGAQLEAHETRHQARAWDTGALVELTDVETWLGKLVASLDAVEARAAARAGSRGGA